MGGGGQIAPWDGLHLAAAAAVLSEVASAPWPASSHGRGR